APVRGSVRIAEPAGANRLTAPRASPPGPAVDGAPRPTAAHRLGHRLPRPIWFLPQRARARTVGKGTERLGRRLLASPGKEKPRQAQTHLFRCRTRVTPTRVTAVGLRVVIRSSRVRVPPR